MIEGKARRLVQARQHAGFETATDAARAYGWEIPTYRSHEAGRRPYDDEQAIRYGKAYRVAPEWLLFARNIPKWAWIKVVSYVGAGAEVVSTDEVLDEVEPPPDSDGDAFGLIVRGVSMSPLLADGDILICRWQPDVSRLLNRMAVVYLEDGRRFVKRLLRGAKSGTYDLIGLDQVIIPGARIERAAEIVWHKIR